MRLPLIILDWFIYLLFSTRVRKRFGKLLPYVFFLFEQLRTARHCFKLLQFSKSMASHFLRLSSFGAFDLRTEEYHLLNDYRELNLSLDACCREISRVAWRVWLVERKALEPNWWWIQHGGLALSIIQQEQKRHPTYSLPFGAFWIPFYRVWTEQHVSKWLKNSEMGKPYKIRFNFQR